MAVTVLSGTSGALYYKPAGTTGTFGPSDVTIGTETMVVQAYLNLKAGDPVKFQVVDSSSGGSGTGTLTIDIFTPVGVGAGANYTIGERIKDKFNRAKFSSLIFEPCAGLATIRPAEQEAFFQTQFSATFDAYLD